MSASVEPAVVAVLEPGYARYDAERTALAPLGVDVLPVPADADAAAALQGCRVLAVLVRERPVEKDLLDRLPDLKLVLRYGVGVDNIDLPAASARQVHVANIPDYGAANEVADHAVALYLAVARRIVTRDAEVRRGLWNIGQAQPVPGHRGATLGIVGFGRIGRAAWARFRALGFARALVADPSIDSGATAEAGVVPADLDRIMAEADAVSLHLPLTDATRHIVDARRIGLMKANAVLINVSRGGLVDEAALAAALSAGRLFGAGLDVFESEPPDPASPLFKAPNTVFSDHAGWYSEFSVKSLQEQAAAEMRRVLAGEPPRNWVNPW